MSHHPHHHHHKQEQQQCQPQQSGQQLSHWWQMYRHVISTTERHRQSESRPVAFLQYIDSSSLTKKLWLSSRDFVSTAFENCDRHVSHDGHTLVFLSVYRHHQHHPLPPPHPTPPLPRPSHPPSQKNKLTNQYSETIFFLLELYVSCDRLSVVGDLIMLFNNSSDPCTAALNVVHVQDNLKFATVS